jgi:hypothetical protein
MKLRSEPPLKAALPLTVLGSSADVRCIPISVADVAFAPSETTESCQPEETDPTPIVVISWGVVSSGAVGAFASWRSVVLAGRSAACPNAKVAAIVSIANNESSFVIGIFLPPASDDLL